MSLQIKNPLLVIGLGGAGSRLAVQASDILESDCLLISNDMGDLPGTHGADGGRHNHHHHADGSGAGARSSRSIHISTGPVVNPSTQMIRGAAMAASDRIRACIGGHGTVILLSNLAGRAGAAMAPVISDICRADQGVSLVCLAVMPFGYEKDRIFNSGISLKRLRQDAECTIVLDNNALLESNPDLSPSACYGIANPAIMHIVRALGSASPPAGAMMMEGETGIIAASRANAPAAAGSSHGNNDSMAAMMEDSLRDSLKMLYEDAPPTAVKRSIVYVVGGSNIPAGVLNSMASLANGALNENVSHMDATSASEESGVVVLSAVLETNRFDGYDPLGVIPKQDTLDWDIPECSIDCKMDMMHQMER